MRKFAIQREAQPLSTIVRAAVIARSDLQFGFARMFQLLNEHPRIEISIVANIEEATRWLMPEQQTEATETSQIRQRRQDPAAGALMAPA